MAFSPILLNTPPSTLRPNRTRRFTKGFHSLLQHTLNAIIATATRVARIIILVAVIAMAIVVWHHYSTPPTPASNVPAPNTVPPSIHDAPLPEASNVTLVRFPSPTSNTDKRNDFTIALLHRILEATVNSYGPYKIEMASSMSRERQHTELIKGNGITLIDNAASIEWEKELKAITFPLRRGLQNYRLLLIHKKNIAQFSALRSLEELKLLRGGLMSDWMTASVMKAANFNLVLGNDYEGLFHMLNHGRFDYFPRALNEIHIEYNARKAQLPSLAIAPGIALHIPSPTFFYVNKNNTVLHDRLETGLWILHKNGELDTLFKEHHNIDHLRNALRNRILFKLDNPYLHQHSIYDTPELWFTP